VGLLSYVGVTHITYAERVPFLLFMLYLPLPPPLSFLSSFLEEIEDQKISFSLFLPPENLSFFTPLWVGLEMRVFGREREGARGLARHSPSTRFVFT